MKSTQKEEQKILTIFTDGSSLGNPGAGGYGAILIIPEKNGLMVQEIGGQEKNTTNNRMELTAVIEALTQVKKYTEIDTIHVYSDSAYVLNGISSWVHNWEKNNWRTSTKESVQNEDLWKALLDISRLVQNTAVIHWKKIKGHSGILGNERCDTIATTFAEQGKMSLFHGTLENYTGMLGADVTVIKKSPSTKTTASKKKSSKPAYTYISMINGVIAQDATWADCEKRVKGVKGARYQKAMDKHDADEIIGRFTLENLI